MTMVLVFLQLDFDNFFLKTEVLFFKWCWNI